MPTEIMPRPDLRTDWEDRPVRRHRHRRRSWIRAEITSRPRLFGAILGIGALAFFGGGLFHPPEPTAGPSVVQHPTAKPSRTGQVPPPDVSAEPVQTSSPTGVVVTPSRVPISPSPDMAHRPRATATHRPTPAPSRTRVTSPRPSRTTVHTPPPVNTGKPKPPATPETP